MMMHELEAAPSRAAISGHPVHPMIVPFPIAFLVGALFADLAFLSSADLFWSRAAVWLLGAGVATGALAAGLGAIDFFSIARARSLAAGWMHFLGNGAALLLAGWNLVTRLGDAAAAVAPGGIILSLATTFILVVTGWLGGELAYRHRIGVMRSAESAAAAVEPGLDPAYAGDRPAGDARLERGPTQPHV
jgi:uncharacterized membrane protein